MKPAPSPSNDNGHDTNHAPLRSLIGVRARSHVTLLVAASSLSRDVADDRPVEDSSADDVIARVYAHGGGEKP